MESKLEPFNVIAKLGFPATALAGEIDCSTGAMGGGGGVGGTGGGGMEADGEPPPQPAKPEKNA